MLSDTCWLQHAYISFVNHYGCQFNKNINGHLLIFLAGTR